MEGRCSRLPWCEEPLQLETLHLIERLSAINRAGFLTINSQPSLNGINSEDPVFGWGGAGGLLYQKAYLEFFAAPPQFERIRHLVASDKRFASLTYHATNHDGTVTHTNCRTRGTTAVTWGVFPGREVLQPTVVDPEAFMVWKDEAFSLWIKLWAAIYDDESASYELLCNIHDSYLLINIVDNDYVNGDIFTIFEEAMKSPPS